MELQKYIGEAIKERKEKLGISRYELAKKTGISYVQLMNIERGESTTTRVLGKLTDALGLKLIIMKK